MAQALNETADVIADQAFERVMNKHGLVLNSVSVIQRIGVAMRGCEEDSRT